MAPSPIRRGSWKPATPTEVAEIFSGCQAQWWIAGGYAIELAIGRPIRDHADIDVLMLRRDQLAVQQALPGWQWQAADPPGSPRPWPPGERLPAGVHDIWCRPGPGEPWRIQVMLDESSDNDWVSRRDERIRRPITSIGLVTVRGIPYLAPEIQLFYKAKNGRPKDETDFAAALPVLTKPQRQWLSDALSLVYGPGHPWRAVYSRATAVCKPCATTAPRRPRRSAGSGRPWSGRNLSQLSHGLTGQYRTMASLPDIWQDADLRIRIPAH